MQTGQRFGDGEEPIWENLGQRTPEIGDVGGYDSDVLPTGCHSGRGENPQPAEYSNVSSGRVIEIEFDLDFD